MSKFGRLDAAIHRIYGVSSMATFGQNLRHASRQLSRNPGFTATVIFTLALSIGANTAVFSVANALMLKNLPYYRPERIGTIFTRIVGALPSDERHHLNGEQWELLRDNVPSLTAGLSASRTSGVNLQADSRVQYLHAGRVSAHYFEVLGFRPMIGRSFSDTEDRPNGPKTTVLSYGVWRSAFGADPNISGKSILLKGEPYTVVGVLPEGVTVPLTADVYTPLQASQEGEGGGTNFDVIVRLRDGATWQQANTEINRVWSLRKGKYELQDDPGAQVSYYTVPLQKGQAATLRPQVLALMLAAGFIPSDCVRESCRVDTGAHVAASAGGRDEDGARRLTLADSKTILDRSTAPGAGWRNCRCVGWVCWVARTAWSTA